MSDKSSHSTSSKKSGKSLKEKRADKKASAVRTAPGDAVSSVTKR